MPFSVRTDTAAHPDLSYGGKGVTLGRTNLVCAAAVCGRLNFCAPDRTILSGGLGCADYARETV